MINYYELIPIDTLFFRGNTPMEAGLQNAASMFPPPVSVIKGAFWTAYCSEKNIAFDKELVDGKIPIEIVSFFIKRGDKFYTKAPATWYYDSDKKAKCGKDLKGVSLCIASEKQEEFASLNMISSAGDVVFAVPTKDAKSMLGMWVDIDFLQHPQKTFNEDTVLFQKEIFANESRTGIGLTQDKQVENGKLYTATHIRLTDDVSFVVGLDTDKSLSDNGKILLGGEKRLVIYSKIASPELSTEKSEQYVSLVPIQATEENLSNIIASGKVFSVAGWDLQKGFHKPTVSWIPQGSVFNERLSGCIPLKNI